jgi:hypothetical protein
MRKEELRGELNSAGLSGVLGGSIDPNAARECGVGCDPGDFY